MMVRKVFGFFYKETRTLHQAAYLLGFFAVLSQVLAFLRDRLLAHIFGASTSLDIYYAAFRIPDFIFVTVASVVSISVLVPFIVEKEEKGREAVREFIDSIFVFFSILMIAATLLAYFLIPEITPRLFKGFSPAETRLVITVSRLLLISPLALGFSNLLGSLTQAYHRFAVYAVAPLLYNAGIIFGIIAFGDKYGPMGVAIGVAIGACLHALVQVPFVMKIGLLPRLRPKFNWGLVRNVAALSVPRTLTLSTGHIALLFLTALASLMAAGSISVLSFSINIQSVPLSIIGVSYSLAAFPTLTRYFAEKNIKAFVEQMATTARHIIFWSLPITALFIVLRAQIVRVLLGTGRFDWSDTRLTAAALAIFTVSSVFQSLLLLFVRAFYSVGRTKKPFYISVFSTAVLIATSYALVKVYYANPAFASFISSLLKVEDLPSTVVLMLPLGYTIGTIVNGLAHWIGFELEFGKGLKGEPGFTRSVSKTVFQSFFASLVVGSMSYVGLAIFEPLFDTGLLLGIFAQGLFAGVLGIAAGVVFLRLLGSRELDEVWKAIHAKFWKANVIATDPEIV
jgi:putative peptidoglycan lipid II flippase